MDSPKIAGILVALAILFLFAVGGFLRGLNLGGS